MITKPTNQEAIAMLRSLTKEVRHRAIFLTAVDALEAKDAPNKPSGMSQKLWNYLQSCSQDELREIISYGAFIADPLSQELIKRLAE